MGKSSCLGNEKEGIDFICLLSAVLDKSQASFKCLRGRLGMKPGHI